LTGAERLAVVVVTHDSAEHLPILLRALDAQLQADDELIVVDNDSGDATVDVARGFGQRVQVIATGRNPGFGAGCHVGARASSAPLLAFINPDCDLLDGCIGALRDAAARHPDWSAWQAAVLLPNGRINTDGGVVHFLGLGWAGDCDEPIERLPRESREVAFPSGAALVVRRETWDAIGGLDPSYFMYCEDLDLGLRLWLGGHRVGVVPEARVVHSYEFVKGPAKWFWLERNRLRTVLSVYPGPLLRRLLPALLTAEVGLLAIAASQGWLSAKLRAQRAVLGDLAGIRRRRRRIQASARITAPEFAARLTASLTSPYLGVDPEGPIARLQAGYWRLVRRSLGHS